MKIKNILILFLFVSFACEAENPPEPPIPDPQDPFEVEAFLPDRRLDKYVISDKLIYLGIKDRPNRNYIEVFDIESEQLIKEISYDPPFHRFLGKYQDTLYISGHSWQANGKLKASLILLDLEGQLLAEYSSDNSCLPPGYEFGDARAIDEKGNLWFDLEDYDALSGNPPIGPELGLLRFHPQTNTCTYWNIDNSNIPANHILEILPDKDMIYLTSRGENDSLHSLSSFDLQNFTLIRQASPDYPSIEDLQLGSDGFSYYSQRGAFDQQLIRADGSEIQTALSAEYKQRSMRYWQDPSGQLSYVFGTAEFDFPDGSSSVTFPFFSKNGEVLIDYRTEFQAFTGGLNGEMHEFPGQTNQRWIIGGNFDGLILKLTFNE
ncbi:MAG: hypothetical protein R8P61_09515 [Bacteroidia bacterium]|nr:hypothetical protein [Bacteroidia bacterium]